MLADGLECAGGFVWGGAVSVRIIQGDCREVLKTLESGSAQMVCTSPPYYGLRRYLPDGHPDAALEIGIEPTPNEYVEQLVKIFREVRRVIRRDGTLWLNLSDSYAGSRCGPQGALGTLANRSLASQREMRTAAGNHSARAGGKPKDRLMIPARVALALQADGWWLRDEIVWHKPRPTPHPVKDRTVCAHEMVYLLTKAPHYYFDWEAIEEPSAYPGVKRKAGKAFRDLKEVDPNAARKRSEADREITVRETRRARSVWSISPSPYTDAHFATMPPDLAERCIRAGSRAGDLVLDPFGGACTTGMVADRLGRDAIMIDLKTEYCGQSKERMIRDAGMFADLR